MEQGKIDIRNIGRAIIALFLIGIGVAFNNNAGLGNDPIGIVYDGIRVLFSMSAEQLGLASTIVNFGLTVLLFIIGRKYVSVGTLIYFLPYGFAVRMGTYLYKALIFLNELSVRMMFAAMGCILLYMGVALFITVDIGVDPFTGITLVITDKLKKNYRIIKVVFDICMVIIGLLLGGKAGAVTFITMLSAGPCIQFFAEYFKKTLYKEYRRNEYVNTTQ
mgnify:CR=1 FL=1